MYGILLTALAFARTVSADDIVTASAVPEPVTALADDANRINDIYTADPSDAQLYVLVRSYFEQVAEQFKTVSGYEQIYAEATAAAAQITDNEAANDILTASGPTYTV